MFSSLTSTNQIKLSWVEVIFSLRQCFPFYSTFVERQNSQNFLTRYLQFIISMNEFRINDPASLTSPSLSQSSHDPKILINNNLKQLKTKLVNKDQQKQITLVKNRVQEFYGDNFPQPYKREYDFNQKWEISGWRPPSTGQYYIKFKNKIDFFLNICITLTNSLAIWLSTIRIFINNEVSSDMVYTIYSCALASQLMEIVVYLINSPKTKRMKYIIIDLLQRYKKNIVIVLFFAVELALIPQSVHLLYRFFQLGLLFILYLQISKRYHSIRVINFSQSYEYHFKVFDLIITLLMIAHIMALILFSSTKAGYATTWLTKAGFQTDETLLNYLYSFYFATTTILTVGYGDITASNPLEMATVAFVEICGIIILGYIISEIGFCVSSLRKRSELLEKDLEVIERMKNYYKLNNTIVHRVNEYLINSYEKGVLITPEEQKYVTNKLNEQLRNQLTQLNLLSIVKSSIFLLCRWSKNMQNSVAMKMQHTLFSPNNAIYQPEGKQRLYFIKSGSIGVYAYNQKLKKLLKTITNSLQKEVSHNSYGYTHVMMSGRVRLQAISKDFTSVYYIQKDKFKESVFECPLDFQYYHQMKNKLQLSLYPERFQVQSFMSRKHHYNPNNYLLIIKANKRGMKSKRKIYIRTQKRYKCYNMVEVSRSIISFHKSNERMAEASLNLSENTTFLLCISKADDELEINKPNFIPVRKDEKQIEWKKRWETNKYKFQSRKDYKNYFPKSNVDEVLYRYQKEGGFSSSTLSTRVKSLQTKRQSV